MRKLCWGCAAVGLATLGVVPITDYACRHPETFVARCVIGAYHAGAFLGPILQAGVVLADRAIGPQDCDSAEVIEIPDEPEQVIVDDPCPQELRVEQSTGRLPGKIVIEEGEEPPMALPCGPVSPEPDVGRFVQCIEEQWANEPDAPIDRMRASIEQWANEPDIQTARMRASFTPYFSAEQWANESDIQIARALQQDPAEAARQMPYCAGEDDSAVAPMPYADEPDAAPRKRPEPRIWNPFPPKSTEVGGHEESELSPHGNDCREDPASAQQIPGCPNPAPKCPPVEKAAPTGEEQSEPPQPEKKKGKRAEPPTLKRTFDESRLTPFAAPVKIDTMEFRPSDWGKNDVALPPF